MANYLVLKEAQDDFKDSIYTISCFHNYDQRRT